MATVKLDPAKGIQIPNLTTTERNAISSPETGAIIWNTTTSEINQYNGSAWEITYTPVAGISSSADATAITIDSSENVGIGKTDPTAKLEASVTDTDSSPVNGTNIYKARSSHSLQISNVSDSATYSGIHLRTRATGASAWSMNNVHTSQYVGDLTFVTRTNTSSASERMRILSSGGITFNGDTATANALDDYEEGNWTPTLTGSGTISHRVGKYVKIGNQIMVQGEIRSTSYNNSGATDVQIGGLPYSSYNESNYNFAANITPISGFNLASDHGVVGYMSPNQSHINLFGLNQSAGANYDFLQQGEMGPTVEVFFAVHYRTN